MNTSTKQRNLKKFSVTLEEDMVTFIDERARKMHRSRNGEILAMLELAQNVLQQGDGPEHAA